MTNTDFGHFLIILGSLIKPNWPNRASLSPAPPRPAPPQSPPPPAILPTKEKKNYTIAISILVSCLVYVLTTLKAHSFKDILDSVQMWLVPFGGRWTCHRTSLQCSLSFWSLSPFWEFRNCIGASLIKPNLPTLLSLAQKYFDISAVLLLWVCVCVCVFIICKDYENTPIQIYRKFHLQKLKIFR